VNTLLKQGYIPTETGLHVPHLRDPQQSVYLSPEILRLLVVFTMADIADQYFGWQDELFGGGGMQGSMIIPGMDFPDRHQPATLWPGVSQPGLWMSYVSDLAQVVKTYHDNLDSDSTATTTLGTVLPIPPVFANATRTLTLENERAARDLYWQVVTSTTASSAHDDLMTHTIELLRTAHEYNPWAFEPLVLLAQSLLQTGDFVSAAATAQRALELQHVWGTAWDKRLPFGAWVAWTRVLHQRATDQEPWPTNSWHVNNLGLVR